jgi:hypothetical protein
MIDTLEGDSGQGRSTLKTGVSPKQEERWLAEWKAAGGEALGPAGEWQEGEAVLKDQYA